jgi:histidinol dehydrogenase
MRVLSGTAAERAVSQLEQRASRLNDVEPAVRRIVQAVRKGGDKAVRRYATLWDSLQKMQSLRVSADEIEAAWKATPAETREALRRAAANIRRFANWQVPRSWSRKISGGELGQIVRPLDSVGCYVPGGRYPLPSTLLMTAIPAQVAGTETVSRVDKIVGPGNAYVTAAKKLVGFDCAIDMLAGPTEALIYSETGNAEFLAADLVAQAEHDPDAVVVFVSTSAALAKAVTASVLQGSKGNAIATKAIKRSACALVAESREQALEWVNRIAAEHLTVDDDSTVTAVCNAGSIFVGDYSLQPAGDYAAGPNHVLPTAGAARFRGGLSAADFVKVITVQKFFRDGLNEIAPVVTRLAEAEGLLAHAQSVRVRCGDA